MQAICELMRTFGVPKRLAALSLQTALERGYGRRADTIRESQRITRLADVCARWHLEKNFTDDRGKPRPLSWNGGSGELRALTARVVGRKDARAVADELVSKKLLRKLPSGDWVPISKVIAPVDAAEAQVSRSASMIGRLLRTIVYNSKLQYQGNVLLEVMSQVPRLPRKDLVKFKAFTKAQGVSFIKAVDDWLESRNLRRAHRLQDQTIEAGVIAFAFQQDRRQHGRTRDS
jgi:hypothetical protein